MRTDDLEIDVNSHLVKQSYNAASFEVPPLASRHSAKQPVPLPLWEPTEVIYLGASLSETTVSHQSAE